MTTLLPKRAFRFTYETTVPRDQAAHHPVDLWIPVSSSNDHQTIGALHVTAPLEVEEGVDLATGNRMLHARIPQGHGDAVFSVAYDVERLVHRVEPPPSDASYGDDHDVAVPGGLDTTRYRDELSANAHVPIDGFIGEQAASIASRSEPPLVKARKIFDHLLDTLEYDSCGCTPERIHELGDLAQACDLRRGTCTEFHGLYVGYARALGMPARFQFGFNIPMDRSAGRIAGYHCWAEVLLPRVGWFPVDVSEVVKASRRGEDLTDFFFGGLHAHRVQVSTGRDVSLTPPQSGPPLDKFIFSHAETNGQAIEPELAFSFADTGAGD